MTFYNPCDFGYLFLAYGVDGRFVANMNDLFRVFRQDK